MDIENIVLSSNSTLCSELNEDNTSLTAKLIICDFSVNKNGVRLNRGTVEDWLYTLVAQPVVGKIGITDDGTADFTGHNFNPVIKKSVDGGIYLDRDFDTSACGVFTSVQIENINGKEYITATAKIWKRFPNFCAIIQKRLLESSISTSWEIAIKKSHTELQNGKKIKVIDEGVFLGHCLLAQHVTPAYDDSCLLEVASDNNDNELIEALNKDLEVSYIHVKKEDEQVANENTEKTVVATEQEDALKVSEGNEVSTESTQPKQEGIVADEATETSMLGEWDLKKALRQAIAEKLDRDKWDINIIFHAPTEQIVWVQPWDAAELDVITFTYTVENDVVTISEPVDAKLTVSVSQINSTIDNLNAELSTKNEALIKANDTIQNLNVQISDITPYKEKFEKVEQEKVEKELSEKKESLKQYALKGGYITEEEIESSEEIKGFIDTLNKKEIQSIIADRVVSSLAETDQTETSSESTNSVETSEKLNITSDEEVSDYRFVIKNFIRK